MVKDLSYLIPNIHVIYQYFLVLQNVRKYFQLFETKYNKLFYNKLKIIIIFNKLAYHSNRETISSSFTPIDFHINNAI